MRHWVKLRFSPMVGDGCLDICADPKFVDDRRAFKLDSLDA